MDLKPRRRLIGKIVSFSFLRRRSTIQSPSLRKLRVQGLEISRKKPPKIRKLHRLLHQTQKLNHYQHLSPQRKHLRIRRLLLILSPKPSKIPHRKLPPPQPPHRTIHPIKHPFQSPLHPFHPLLLHPIIPLQHLHQLRLSHQSHLHEK